MKFLAQCINPDSPEWVYSTYRGDVQLEADSAADARTRLTVFYANPVKTALDKAVHSIPWLNPEVVKIDEVTEFDPAIPIAVVTAP